MWCLWHCTFLLLCDFYQSSHTQIFILPSVLSLVCLFFSLFLFKKTFVVVVAVVFSCFHHRHHHNFSLFDTIKKNPTGISSRFDSWLPFTQISKYQWLPLDILDNIDKWQPSEFRQNSIWNLWTNCSIHTYNSLQSHKIYSFLIGRNDERMRERNTILRTSDSINADLYVLNMYTLDNRLPVFCWF